MEPSTQGNGAPLNGARANGAMKRAEASEEERIIRWYRGANERRFRRAQQIIG